MDEVYSPFSTARGRVRSPYDDDEVMGGGARGLVNDFQRADRIAARHDPLADAQRDLSQRKTQLGYAKQAAEQLRDTFLANEGSDLFERDPATNKVLKNPDGTYMPKLGPEIDALRSKSQETVGLIRGALTSAVRGDPTPDAIEAGKQLAEREPLYKAKLDKWERIQAQIHGITAAHDANELELGNIAAQRLARDSGIQLGTPPAAAPAASPQQGSSARSEPQAHNPVVVGSNPTPAPISPPPAQAAPVAPPTTAPGGGPTPLALLKLHQEIKGNETTIGLETSSDHLKEALRQKNERLTDMFMKGMTTLTPISRQRVIDITRDPTLGEKVKDFVGRVGEGLGGTVLDAGEFTVRNALRLTGQDADAPTQQKVKEFADAMREEAAGWGHEGLAPEVVGKLREGLSGSVGQGIGSTIAFIAPTSIVGGAGKMLGLGKNAINALMTATVAATGAASEANNFRREAEAHLQDDFAAGKISKDEMSRALGMAEVFGGAMGSTEAFTGISRMARRIGEGAAGKSFLRKLFDMAGTGGPAAAAKWLVRGPGAKAAVDVASEMLEEATQEFGQTAGENLYASLTFDKGREVLPEASGAAGSAAISTLIVSALTQALGLPGQTRRYKALGEAVNRGAEARNTSQGPDGGAGSAPNTGSGREAGPAPATPAPGPATPEVAPASDQDGRVLKRWTFTDATGAQQTVTGTGLKDAKDKLPEGFKPNLKVTPTQVDLAPAPAEFIGIEGEGTDKQFEAYRLTKEIPGHAAGSSVSRATLEQAGYSVPPMHYTPKDLGGEKIDKEWTAFSGGSQSLGIPRAEMPQIKAEHRGALTQFLKARGVESTEEEILPGALKPTQAEFSQAKVDKARKFTGGDRAILVSSDNHVLDGHHQWMAKLTDEPDTPMRVIRLNAPIKDLLQQVGEFPSVQAAAGATAPKTSSQPAAPKPGKGAGASEQMPQATAPSAGKPIIARGKNNPATFVKAISKAAKLKGSDRAGKFLADFAPRLHRMNPKAFGDMEVHVLNQQEWDSTAPEHLKAASASYDPKTNALFVNSDRSAGENIANVIVHEAGHFAEKFALGEDFTQAEWGKLTHAQRVRAWNHYSGEENRPTDLDEDVMLKDKQSRSEWVAMQFARVVRGDTAGMSKSIKSKLEKFLKDVRALVGKWIGDGKLSTKELDAKILEIIGYNDDGGPGPGKKAPKQPTAPTAPETKPANGLSADADRALRTAFDGLLGTPADQVAQEGIPAERIGAFVTAAHGLINNGVRTPEAMADVLDRTFDKKARKYSQALWNAIGMVDPSLSSQPDWTAVYSAADKGSSPTDQRPPSSARTETAPTESQQGPGEQKPTTSPRKGKRISVGVPASGIGDILNDIEAMGGIKSRSSVENPGGEYDGQAGYFGGVARLLIRQNGGLAPDELASRLHDDGVLPDGHPTTMYDAVEKAVKARQSERKQVGRREYEDRFDRAFLGNQHPREWLRAGNPITVDDLSVGDEFTVEGEKFKVKDVDEDGNVTIEDGITRTVPAGTPVYPDKGKVKHPKRAKGDFFDDAEPAAAPAPEPAAPPAPAKAGQEDMFGSDEMPFNLAGTDQQDGERLLKERIEREDARREQEKNQTQIPGTEKTPNEPSPGTDLERNRPGANPGERGGEAQLPDERGAARTDGGTARGEGAEQQGGDSAVTGGPAPDGEESDSALPELKAGAIGPETSADAGEQPSRGVSPRGQRILDDAGADTAVDSVAPERPGGDVVARSRDRSDEERRRAQRAAESKPVVTGDLKNIAETLPMLLPEQQDDVLKAERRLLEESPVPGDPKRGILFTNGTGTGKTYTGLGVIKRSVRRGAKDILIVVPTFKKAIDWQNDAKNLQLNVGVLEGTLDRGKGINVTTYANFRMNEALRNRDFDLIVYDESHKLVQNEEGGQTSGNDAHRFVTNHPDILRNKVEERIVGPRPHPKDAKYPGEGFEYPGMPNYDDDAAAWEKKRDAMRAEIAAEENRIKAKTKVVFLSATPFAYHKTLTYAEGYLFEVPRSEGGLRYNQAGGFDQFLVENFGYRMRYNKLTIPESGVDVDLMEREFADRLMKAGAVSGRMIDVPYDYSREFVLVDPGLGAALDKGIGLLYGYVDHDRNKWRYLPTIAGAKFKYHYVQQLMEAIKVAQSLERIRQHIALGRKIILFHNYVNAVPDHPFRGLEMLVEAMESKHERDEAKKELIEFNERYPELRETDFGRIMNPLALMEHEFPGQIVFFNGNVSDKKKLAAVDAFNDDKSKVKIIMAQSESMKEGVSAHDVTGKHQRVVANVGLPIKPTDAIQEEGRAYRVGVKSNAINEYIVIHTNTEKHAFGSKINLRVRTAENLALGSQARALQDAFKQGYLNPVEAAPDENQGKGGKASDRRSAVATPYDRARSFYFGRQKKTSKTKSAEGVDYYATPEPIGFKMVEWVGARANERLLEPSVGHGAIGRFFPNFTTNHFIEPSTDLANEARIKIERGMVDVGTYEDFNIGNKFDGIVMNPPFGLGGSTAMKHLAKAAQQVKDGGRIIALIPEGPAADERFNKWYEAAPVGMIKVAEFGLPNVTFERAGTNVKTRIVVLDRIDNARLRSEAPVQARIDIQAETVEELFQRFEHLQVPPRQAPAAAAPASPLTGRDAVLPAGGAQVGDYASEEFKHTKTGAPIYVAKPTKYLGDGFAKAKQAAARAGGRYSSFKGAGAIPGFHFDTAAARDAFIDGQRATPSGLGTPAVKGTQQQEEILNKVTGTLEDKRTFGQRVTDYLADLGDYLRREVQQKLLDRFTAIKRLERAAIGTNDLDASISAYKWSRLTSNLAGVMEYLTRHGQIAYENGSMKPVPGTKGLVDILKPIVESGRLRLWEGYVAAYRANNLLKEGREKNFGKQFDQATQTWTWDKARAQQEIDELLKLGEQYPEFEQVRQEYVAFQKSVLDVATAAGLIDPARRAMWERSDYVPFYRIVDALDGNANGPRARRGFSGQRSGVRRLKGAPEQVAILENIFRNIEQMVDASFKNIAMQRIADLADQNNDLMVRIPYKAVPFKTTVEETLQRLEAAGVDVSSLSEAELDEIVTFWRMRAPEGKDVVSAMNNGKPTYYRVKDKPLLRSILAMGPDRHSWWMKMLMAPKKALTSLVTLDPAFMAANTIRDSLSSWVISDNPIKPGWDAMRGFVKSLRNDPAKLAILAAGGGTGHYNNMRESEVRQAFLRMTREQRDGFLNSIIDTPAKLARMYRDLGRATENANRVAIAEAATKAGASPAEAAFQALDIMDFGLRGDSKALAFFLDTVPFMNARIQGLYRLGRGLMNDPKRVATHGAMIMGATLALMAANWDDDRYWELPEWDRDLYYHMWPGGRHIRIPKPFEVGQIFSTMPERMMQFLAKDGDSRLFARRMLSMIGDTFAMNPLPQAIKPLAERAMNMNMLTGGKIISRGDEYKPPEQQFNAYTSAVSREIAEGMPDSAPSWLRSPKTLDFLVRGYFGSLGMYAMDAGDAVVRAANDYPEQPAAKMGDYWLMRRFSPESDLRDNKYVSEFYDLHSDIEQLETKVKTLREQGDVLQANAVAQENRGMIAYGPVATATNKALTAIRRRERQIHEDRTMTADQKRTALALIEEQKNRLAEQAVRRAPNRPRPILYNPFGR